jgi:hypothetical protein
MSCATFWRKSFIHRIALPAPLATLTAADAATKKPNPLFILIDHEGISDVGCYGSDLTESGVRPYLVRLNGGLGEPALPNAPSILSGFRSPLE